MFGRFFGNKVTVQKNAVVGEIVINIPDFSGPNVPALYWPLRNTRRIILTAPIPITCLELKKRICGKTSIPISCQAILFMGSIVNSNEELIPDMYEQELTEDSDDDIFRPRLYLGIIDEPKDEVINEENFSESESSAESSIGDLDYAIEKKEEEKRIIENKQLSADYGEDDKSERTFDLKKNLEKIGCSRFYDDLIAEGFIDEGSFSNLTDDILKNPPLCLPLVSRQRITALADVTKRRLENQRQAVAETEAGKIDTEMMKTGKLKTRTIEGLEGTFTKKIDMKRAWEKKIQEETEEAKKQALACEEEIVSSEFQDLMAPQIPRKELPDNVLELINKVKVSSERDENECLLDPSTITTSTFCCLRHYNECIDKRNELEEMNRMLLEADLQVAADRVDYHRSTFVCRYQLRHILKHYFEKFRIPYEERKGEELLDACVMNEADQVRLREWASPEKRENPLFDIPQSGYSTHRFARVVSDEIIRIQQKNILVVDE